MNRENVRNAVRDKAKSQMPEYAQKLQQQIENSESEELPQFSNSSYATEAEIPNRQSFL